MMERPRLTVAKFGGSAIGADGAQIPAVISRARELARGSKVVAVVSAPLTAGAGGRRSLTDVVLEQGASAEAGRGWSLDAVRDAYGRIAGAFPGAGADVGGHLEEAGRALDEAAGAGFADEVRARALAFSGEIPMSRVMAGIMSAAGLKSEAVRLEDWPIITDENTESANFVAAESEARMGPVLDMVSRLDVVVIGGFVGRTAAGGITTYERGGSDRTAADLGILFRRSYEASIDFEKDSAVASADPKVVGEGLRRVGSLSYNEARTAGMFGMKILDPVAIKELAENGVDMPITVTNMGNPSEYTTITRSPGTGGDPIKMVTGRGNCAILRAETGPARRMLDSLESDRRYGEFVALSPSVIDGAEMTRLLFLDGDYVRRNEKYLLAFDPLASITYGRGVVTLVGDGMSRAQHVASRASASVGGAGLNILNMDAQEETSRIIIVIDDAGDGVERAVRAVHGEMMG